MLKSKEIIRDIIEDITLGKYKVDERMPSENQLAIKYNCNRHTVRKVIEILIERGYLRRIHGGPTYINSLPSNHSLNFSSLLELYGESAITSKVVKFKLEVATPKICNILKLEKGSKVWSIIRIRYVSTTPSHTEETFIPYSLLPDLKEEDCLHSLLHYVENSFDYEVSHAIKNISAIKLSKKDCEYLQLPEDSLALQIENTGYLTNGRPYEYSINKHRDNNITYYAKR